MSFNEKASPGIENPAYDSDFNLSKDYEKFFTETEYDDDMLEATMDDILNEEKLLNTDIDTLNNRKSKTHEMIHKWRNGPAPIEEDSKILDLKLGSLDGTYVDHEDIFTIKDVNNVTLSKQKRLEAAATAYINYFSYLGTTDDTEKIDFHFVENLLKSTDGNCRDKYGQSVMHEIAREWHTDAALFFKLRGVNIDGEDNYGRTPLFVAVAVNNDTMVRWLIDNGANIDHKTMKGEGQSALHYAAKYDSIESFDVLMKHGADPLERDHRGKTAMFIAAEYGQLRMCKHLINLELPVASYSHDGVSAIDHILEKLPEEVAYAALDQFITHDPRNGNLIFYISCLGKRRWRLLNKNDNTLTKQIPPDPIEIVIERNDLKLITHPVFLKLLQLKSSQFATTYVHFNVLFYFLFTLLWTASMSMIEKEEGYSSTNTSALVLGCIAQIIAFFYMFKLFREFSIQKKIVKTEKTRIREEIKLSEEFIHPRWPIEQRLREKKEELVERLSYSLLSDGWTAIEILALIMSTVEFIIMLIWMNGTHIKYIDETNQYYAAVFVLVLWIRLNRSLRFLQSLGPFIAMLGECLTATAQFGFLFFEFFVPFACAFWVIFGGNRAVSQDDNGEYVAFNDMLYQLYLLTIVGDYEYKPLKEIDETTAQILVGMYFLFVSIVSLNLYIALLSEAFARVNQTASAIAYLKEAAEIINIEQNFPEVKRKFEIYINKFCAPLVVQTKSDHNKLDFINPRSKLIVVGQQAKMLNQNLEYLVKDAEKTVTAIKIGEESIKKFIQEFNEEKTEELRDKLDDVFEFQTTLVNKAQRKARSKIARLIDYGTDKLVKFQEDLKPS